ncbi:MAG: hypothetical protein KBA40_03155 [Candidatus Peribacteraceae bacterium]|nr:hypothetical protein [Candidatus Peribacteraceae bacterium]
MLQRLRESLSLILIAVLPMHAMLVTVLTHALQGQNHAPLAILTLWKEVLLAVIMTIAMIEIIRTKEPVEQKSVWSLDLLDWCIVLGVALGAAVSLSSGAGSSFSLDLSAADKRFLLGFKYDFLPLVAFFLLRRVSWSRNFLFAAARTIVMVAAVAAIYGIVTLFVPLSFFTSIGYSDLHSLYQPTTAIASFQYLEASDIRRIQSFMSGPNQFGLWLLLPFSASLLLLIKSIREHRRFDAAVYTVLGILFMVALALTYSRSAWIGAAVIVGAVILLVMRHTIESVLHRSLVLTGIGILAGFLIVIGITMYPQILVRAQSLQGHLEKPLQALQTMRTHPFGLGLGTAGPASNRLSDTCVFLELGADYTWTKSHPNLCVFLGGVRKLPAGKACECPLLTENWYLQWGVEMGYAGLILSLMIVGVALAYGIRFPLTDVRLIPALALLGVAVGGMFLHSFEDGAVAYTIWLLLSACALGHTKPRSDA